jgi:hypothetical protein
MFGIKHSKSMAAAVIASLSMPAAAHAMWIAGPGSGASQQLTRTQQVQLDQLSRNVSTVFASEGGWHLGTSAPNPTAAFAHGGFQWGDAGIGAAGVLALVGVGSGAAFVIRRRVHQPLAS